MGNGVDIFALCDLSLSACEDNSATLSRYKRYDAYYSLDGTQSVESEDRQFNGTSSTPIAVGIMATKLEYNRDWTWADMKHWFKTPWVVLLREVQILQEHLQCMLVLKAVRITQVRCGLMTAPSKVVMRLSFGMSNRCRTKFN